MMTFVQYFFQKDDVVIKKNYIFTIRKMSSIKIYQMINIRVLYVTWLAKIFIIASLQAQDQYSYSGFEAPVSVAQYGGFYYLSNSGKNFGTATRDGDGFISRLRSDGSQDEPTMKYITGLNNPRGIYATRGTLYICDIDRLVAVDLRTGRKISELSFEKEGVTQLTHITSVDDKTLFVSATDADAIFEVDPAAGTYSLWAKTPSPTGLLVANGQMYVCSNGKDSLANGKLGIIDMKTKRFTQLSDDEGYLWGLALHGRKLFYSDWVQFAKRGVIKWIDLQNSSSGEIKFTSKIGGPADFLYDARNDLFIIPAVLEGVVFGCIGFTK